MDLFKIISEIEKVDPEVYERLDPRRRVFQHLSGIGKTLGAAALPGFFSSVFNRAYGQSTTLPSGILDVLNFALKLEYMEAIFYNQALNAPGLTATLTGAGRDAITKIRTDENNHVTFLRTAISGGGGTPVTLTQADFDYTGAKGGTRAPLFPDVFVNYQTFLTVAQAFEDTGVRAYKGGAPALMANKTILEAALDIHSVEARHASHLRTMRRGGPTNASGTAPKSWVSGTDSATTPAAAQPVYGAGMPATPPSGSTAANASKFFPAEDNVTQAGVNLQTALSQSAAAVSEAFDEPLDSATVAAIALNFRIGNTF